MHIASDNQVFLIWQVNAISSLIILIQSSLYLKYIAEDVSDPFLSPPHPSPLVWIVTLNLLGLHQWIYSPQLQSWSRSGKLKFMIPSTMIHFHIDIILIHVSLKHSLTSFHGNPVKWVILANIKSFFCIKFVVIVSVMTLPLRHILKFIPFPLLTYKKYSVCSSSFSFHRYLILYIPLPRLYARHLRKSHSWFNRLRNNSLSLRLSSSLPRQVKTLLPFLFYQTNDHQIGYRIVLVSNLHVRNRDRRLLCDDGLHRPIFFLLCWHCGTYPGFSTSRCTKGWSYELDRIILIFNTHELRYFV